MLNELLELKAEAEYEMVYAKAKIEVVEKLLAKMDKATTEPTVVEEHFDEVALEVEE